MTPANKACGDQSPRRATCHHIAIDDTGNFVVVVVPSAAGQDSTSELDAVRVADTVVGGTIGDALAG
eukprot:3257337-Prymnesium_polylepis.1